MTVADDDLAIESCSGCRFFVPGTRYESADGTCHRHAPMQFSGLPVAEDVSEQETEYGSVALITVTSYFGWPAILASDWCGEFEARR